jgi:hypothetical protein
VELSYEGSLDSRKVDYLKGRESTCEGIEYVAIELVRREYLSGQESLTLDKLSFYCIELISFNQIIHCRIAHNF